MSVYGCGGMSCTRSNSSIARTARPLRTAFVRMVRASGTSSATSCHKHKNMLVNKGQSGRPQIVLDASLAVQPSGKVAKNSHWSTDRRRSTAKDASPQSTPCAHASTCLRTTLSRT